MARKLLKPEEVMTLPPRIAITFPGGGMPAVVTKLIRYYEEPQLMKGRGWFRRQWKALGVLIRSP